VSLETAAPREQLKAYLRDQSLALITSAGGFGYPDMVVYDPHGFISWFPRTAAEDHSSGISGAYLFEGTYSERRWSESATTPFLPEGVVVKGVIPAPPGAGTLQYARRMGRDALLPGRYVVNTIDETHVQHIGDFLRRMGFDVLSAQSMPMPLSVPIIGHVSLSPVCFVSVATMLFLVLGHICAALHWSLYLRGRGHEFEVRRCQGARPQGLIRECLVGGLPGLVAGAVGGVIVSGILSGLLVAVIGDVPLTPGNSQTLSAAGVVASVSVMATWSVTFLWSVAIRPRKEVNPLA